MHGTPADWFGAYGWRVFGAANGRSGPRARARSSSAIHGPNPEGVPSVCWFKTRKGRGYWRYDYKTHGSPHKPNCDVYWETKRPFAEKYGVEFEGFGQPAPEGPGGAPRAGRANLRG